jgi:hypothetical protein
MSNQRVFDFWRECVRVFVPDQKQGICVKSVPRGLLKNMPGIPGYFEPKRLVIKIEFCNAAAPLEDLTYIEGGARLEVQYTPQDVENAGGDWRDLKLGFYFQDRWWLFTEEKHKFTLYPDGHDPDYGVGVAYLTTWADPAIGWDG